MSSYLGLVTWVNPTGTCVGIPTNNWGMVVSFLQIYCWPKEHGIGLMRPQLTQLDILTPHTRVSSQNREEKTGAFGWTFGRWIINSPRCPQMRVGNIPNDKDLHLSSQRTHQAPCETFHLRTTKIGRRAAPLLQSRPLPKRVEKTANSS